MSAEPTVLDTGSLPFSIESRILQELGERLVKQPEVAILELVKNAYDADATSCSIEFDYPHSIIVEDTGTGMTLARFRDGWMRIGTSSKVASGRSEVFERRITGEKGIGRFAVRFLGRNLHLVSVADDKERRQRTRLIADFDWPRFDRYQDIGEITVPYRLEVADANEPLGTKLVIGRLRPEAATLDLKKVRTGSISILTPLRSLFRTAQPAEDDDIPRRDFGGSDDPGFQLKIRDEFAETDVAAEVLDGFVLRVRILLTGDNLDVRVYRKGTRAPHLKVIDKYPNSLDGLYADIRFFPRRKGSFANLSVDGRTAAKWVVDNSGVAVFDRNFRVQPYGTASDDWLQLAADAARNTRDPRSSIAIKHFPMSQAVRAAPSENWMIRLPQSAQLVGIVQVEGRRAGEGSEEGLIASADREGFVLNETFRQMHDIVRGAVEMIAVADRELQQEEDRKSREAMVASIREETQAAIREIQANSAIEPADKARIIAALAQTEKLAAQHEETARERERQLEIMSLLGVVAGFMTHEFGIALRELETTHADLVELAAKQPRFNEVTKRFADHIKGLKDFVDYSQAYIRGSRINPQKPYPARARLQQVKRVFGKYAEERNISIEITAEPNLLAPMVPASLYNGIALNLYTNSLKAVTAKASVDPGLIAFRAWNDHKWHYLQVSDNGVGIPSVLKDRVFDPLFTTTDSRRDPLGSGMGLGLALVRRASEAFGGRADLVTPPPNFATCVQVRLPLQPGGG